MSEANGEYLPLTGWRRRCAWVTETQNILMRVHGCEYHERQSMLKWAESLANTYYEDGVDPTEAVMTELSYA